MNFALKHFRALKWIIKNYSKINFEHKITKSSDVCIESEVFHGPLLYSTDGLATSNCPAFLNTERFKKAYAAASATNPWENFTLQWRVYLVCFFADSVKNLEGDFVECGVNTGAFSRAIIDYINFPSTGKKFYLFDTFEGMVESQITREEMEVGIGHYLNNYRNVYDEVVKTFSPFNVQVVKGIVPESLIHFKGDKVCYLSIDMNVVEPEIKAFEFFWDKVVSGGVIILDDYGFPQHVNQRLAFDKLVKKYNVDILCLPTGQGIIFKP